MQCLVFTVSFIFMFSDLHALFCVSGMLCGQKVSKIDSVNKSVRLYPGDKVLIRNEDDRFKVR